MARKERIDMTGRRFGRLVGLGYSHRDRSGHAHWVFACDCGAELVAHGGNVRAGGTTSCGCRHREISAARLHVHGARARRRHAPTYRAWQTMKSVCPHAGTSGYPRCGGHGIRVATCWDTDFVRFLADMGERPAGTTLARIDPAGDFTPDNCRWIPIRVRAERASLSSRLRGGGSEGVAAG